MIPGTLIEQKKADTYIYDSLTFSDKFSQNLSLLNHDNPDIVLTAIQTLYNLRDIRALGPLRSLLSHTEIEVAHAAILAIGHLGDGRVVHDLAGFLKADPLLQTAAVYALWELRSPSAIAPLSQILRDSIIGPIAAEAIACIGGTAAFRVLVKHWLESQKRIDTENYFVLLRYVIEGIADRVPKVQGFCESIAPYLNDTNNAIRTSAACCLLATGPCADDEKALAILTKTFPASSDLPACLSYRSDLVRSLLKADGSMKRWGFQMVSLFPKSVSGRFLIDAVNGCDGDCEYVNHIAEALMKVKDPVVAPAVLNLYLRVSWNMRTLLHPLMRIFKKQIRSLLIDCDTDDEIRVVISSNIGISPVCIALEILDLPLDSRILVISLLSENKTIMKCLPWTRWLENNPGYYITVAADVAVKTHFKELLPVLRKALAAYPVARIIRAVGELGDRESIPALMSHLSSASSYTRSLIIETLGRIGGKEAVDGLKNAVLSPEPLEKRLAFRALSGCIAGDDCAFFRHATSNPDWYIRLMSVDAISRRPDPDNFSALVKLSADPVPVVAQRAFYFLKYLPMSGFLPVEDVHSRNIVRREKIGEADQHGYANKTEQMPVNMGVKTRRVS